MRKEFSFRRVAVFIALLCGLVWIGWYVIRDTAGQYLVFSSPDEALQLAPNDPVALDQLAYNEIAKPDGDMKVAEIWAQRALRANPLDDRALLLLGLIAERNHDGQRAEVLARMAGERSWRNAGTQLWLFERAVRDKDYDHALLHADAVLRPNLLNQNFSGLVFPTLAAFINYSPSFKTLVDFLVARPPWRAPFLNYLCQNALHKAQLDQLYAALKDSSAPPTKSELSPYLDELIQSGRYAQARQVWHDFLPAARRADQRYLFNGDFSQPVDGLPFNWMLTSRPGADIDIVEEGSNDKKSHMLRVQFSGTRVSFSNVRELIALQPGRYFFSGKVRAADFRTPRGLWWHIFCVGEANRTLAHTDLISEDTPWADFRIEFTVPDDCVAQWVQLELPARISSERQIEGQIWYQFLQIAPVSGRSDSRF